MYQNAVYICIFDIAKFTGFQWKTDGVSRNQGVYHVIIYFLDFLKVRYNWANFHHCRISVTNFREEGSLFAPHPWAARKDTSWIGLMFLIFHSLLFSSLCYMKLRFAPTFYTTTTIHHHHHTPSSPYTISNVLMNE